MQRAKQIQSLRKSFTRPEKFFNQLMRQQFACCSITVQQVLRNCCNCNCVQGDEK